MSSGCPDPGTDFSLFSLASPQQLRNLLVKLSMAERGTVTVSGTVHVAKASRVYKLKPVSVDAGAGATLKIRVHVQAKVRRAVARALRRGKRAFARLTITARDSARNTRIEKRTVNFRR